MGEGVGIAYPSCREKGEKRTNGLRKDPSYKIQANNRTSKIVEDAVQ